MSDTFDRRRHRFPENRFFEDLAVGEQFYIPSRTVTEANFAAFQTVSGDNPPIHYDIEYCRERGHPGLLAHGFQVLCFTAAGAGTFAHVIGDSLIALYRAIVEIPEAGLSRRHALSESDNRSADPAAHDRHRHGRGD